MYMNLKAFNTLITRFSLMLRYVVEIVSSMSSHTLFWISLYGFRRHFFKTAIAQRFLYNRVNYFMLNRVALTLNSRSLSWVCRLNNRVAPFWQWYKVSKTPEFITKHVFFIYFYTIFLFSNTIC